MVQSAGDWNGIIHVQENDIYKLSLNETNLFKNVLDKNNLSTNIYK